MVVTHLIVRYHGAKTLSSNNNCVIHFTENLSLLHSFYPRNSNLQTPNETIIHLCAMSKIISLQELVCEFPVGESALLWNHTSSLMLVAELSRIKLLWQCCRQATTNINYHPVHLRILTKHSVKQYTPIFLHNTR